MDKQKNLDLFFEKLEKTGVDTTELRELLGEYLQKATFNPSFDSGLCGEGTFLSTILYELTPYAVRINELLPENKRASKTSLVKVCLLHQIAKAIRLIPNDNTWEIEKRGILYKYDASLPSIRTGLHSLAIAQSCGINFSIDEVEAMTIIDKDLTDNQARYHSSVMASIIRQANELTYLTNKP
jgi:hypothetical protein